MDRCLWRAAAIFFGARTRSEEHTSELQSQFHLVCRLLLEKKKFHDLLAQVHKVRPQSSFWALCFRSLPVLVINSLWRPSISAFPSSCIPLKQSTCTAHALY